MRDAFDVNAAGGDVGGYGANIDLHLYEVDQDRKLGLLEKMLVDETGSFLVFAKTSTVRTASLIRLSSGDQKPPKHSWRPCPVATQHGN